MDDGAAGIQAAEPGVTAVQEQPKTGAAGVITVASENKSGPNVVQTVNGGAVPMSRHLTGGATPITRTSPQNNVTSSQQTVPTVTLVRPPVPNPSSSSPASPAASSSSGSVPDKVEGTKPIIQAVAPAATATITSPTVLQNLRTPAPSTIAISTGGGARALGQQMVAPRLAQPQQTTTSVQNIQLPPGNPALHLPHRLQEPGATGLDREVLLSRFLWDLKIASRCHSELLILTRIQN